jgi:hypothetical protein
MKSLPITLGLLCVLQPPLSLGCGEDRAGASQPDDLTVAGSDSQPSAAECQHFVLEPDFEGAPLMGPNVQGGQLLEGEYIISSTYLQLRAEPEAQKKFGELTHSLTADLMSRDGLLALSLGDSKSCGTARTLAVWRDDVAMFGFVTGEAHSRAVAAIDELSRGGSVVMHWTGDAGSVNWSSAMNYLAEAEGPFY